MDWINTASRRLRKGSAYKSIFQGEGNKLTVNGETVIEDLARFCYATKTTTQVGPTGVDPIATAQAEGRRQVYLRIIAHLTLPESAILESIARNQDHE